MLGFENYASESLASKQLCRAFLLDSDALVLSGVLTRMAPNIEAVSKLTEAPHLAPVGWLCEPRKHSKSCRGLVRGGAARCREGARRAAGHGSRACSGSWLILGMEFEPSLLGSRSSPMLKARSELREAVSTCKVLRGAMFAKNLSRCCELSGCNSQSSETAHVVCRWSGQSR